MWTMNKWIVVASYLFLLPLQTVAIVFKNNGDMTCGYPVVIEVNNATCNGSEYCQFGDTMIVNGQIELQANLPSSEMKVTTVACFMGMKYFCKTYTETMNVCTKLGVSDNNDGTACPNAGSFYFGSSVKLPAYPNYNLGSGK